MAQPLYQKIYHDLVEKIRQGVYRLNGQFPSEKELLDMYGVSRITAIHVLNDLEKAGYILRQRGYGNKLISLEGTKQTAPASKIIGLIIPFLSYPHVQPEHFQYVQGVNDCLLAGEYRAVIYTRNDTFDERALLLKAREDGCAGLICLPEVMHYIFDLLYTMASDGYPLVLLDQPASTLPIPTACPDNRQAQRELVEHLIEQGHRSIAYYAYDGVHSEGAIGQRFLGYNDALRAAGISPNPSWVRILKSGDCIGNNLINNATTEELDEHLWQLLKSLMDEGCTAICAENDYTAGALASLLAKKGVTADQMTVAGFDGLSLVNTAPLPMITTRQDFYHIGYEAARVLLQILNHQHFGSKEIRVPNLGIHSNFINF